MSRASFIGVISLSAGANPMTPTNSSVHMERRVAEIGPTFPIGPKKGPENFDVSARIESWTPTNSENVFGFPSPQPLKGIPKAFVSLGAHSKGYGIVVEKLHHRLSVLHLKNDGLYETIRTFRAITGKDPRDKVMRGDLRTPEGIYFVTKRMEGHQLAPKYGPLAFALDFPNIWDRKGRKSGYGIWVHSTNDPKRLLKPFDTEGCVTLSQEDIIALEKYIIPFETPIVIVKEMHTVTPEELDKPRSMALAMIDSWRESWERTWDKRILQEYLGYYSSKFRSLGMSKKQWESFKKQLGHARKGDISVTIENPKIIAFENQLLVSFLQRYRSKQKKDYGRKFLYLEWEGDRYRIIAEKWYKMESKQTAQTSSEVAGEKRL